MDLKNSQDTLDRSAYGGIEGEKYIPYIKNKAGLKETSISSIIIGIILSLIFASANVYLGLTAGMTIAAGIPGAVLGMGLLFTISKRLSILEGNIMQAMASGGESVASGIVFVLPALIIIGSHLTFIEGFFAGISGLLIGVAIIVLVRKYLVIKLHGELVYPESMAISEVLVSSNSMGRGFKLLGIGSLIGGAIKTLGNDIFSFFNSAPGYIFSSFKGQLAVAVSPAFVGVGYIIGLDVCLAMAAGTVLANLGFIPLIGLFGSIAPDLIMFPSNEPISLMSASSINSIYIRYIGAGVIASGAFITIIKMIPVIIKSIRQTFSHVSIQSIEKDSEDLSLKVAFSFAFISFLIIMLISESLVLGIISGSLVVLCSFLFAIVGARMTGVVGTSNLPISGMLIASLLIITPSFVILGYSGSKIISLIVLLGTAIITAISVGGALTQTMKVTFIIGGSTKTVQKLYILGGALGIATAIGVIMLLEKVYGFTSENSILVAPQANLMAMIINGVMKGDLPWILILTGIAIAISLTLLRLPIMSVALGIYLPMVIVFAMLAGGIIRALIENKYKRNERELDEKTTRGNILAAGLVTGEALLGLAAAFLALMLKDSSSIFKVGSNLLGEEFTSSAKIGIAVMILFLYTIYKVITSSKEKS